MTTTLSKLKDLTGKRNLSFSHGVCVCAGTYLCVWAFGCKKKLVREIKGVYTYDLEAQKTPKS